MKTISVLIADDHTVVRQGFVSLLSAEPDITVVGEASNGREAVQLALQILPDIIVMDLAMPQLNGLEAIRQLAGMGIKSRMLILSSYSDDEYVRQVVGAGVSGYLTKQTAASNLIKAVREAAKGNHFFSPCIAKRYHELSRTALSNGQQSAQKDEPMTRRQREILQLIAEGKPNKQVAVTLGISIKTVEKHRQHLMNGLGIHDIAGLTRYAVAHGIVEAEGGSGLTAEQTA
jgi:DNA-binding NarL/FixJ family response regulator